MSSEVIAKEEILDTMLRPAASIAEKMIKVDHAGENGAVNIYRAQILASKIRARALVPQLAEFQRHEEEHRKIFGTYLSRNGIRRCVSYHACGLGGYVLGFVTGLVGPNAVAATTYAVESVVLKHLEEQLAYLEQHGRDAYDCVSAIYDDELKHHDEAEGHLSQDGFLTKVLIAIVKGCTELVVRFGMR